MSEFIPPKKCMSYGPHIDAMFARVAETISVMMLPTLYNGLTAAQCYGRWITNRTIIEMGGVIETPMTELQIATAKTEHARLEYVRSLREAVKRYDWSVK